MRDSTISSPKKNKYSKIKHNFMKIISVYGMLIITLLLIVIFQVISKNFITVQNFKNILEQNAALAIVSVGITFAIISGNMDLSPGGVIAFSCVITGLVFQYTGNIFFGFICGVFTAILIGIFHGILIARVDINPVIVTLSAMIWARGLALAFTKANSIIVDDPVINIINGWSFLGISLPIILMVLVYILGWWVLNKTKLGRYTFALGGNETATKQAGINVARYKIFLFAFSGFMVGLASIISLSRLGSAQPNIANGMELDAIVAVVIGGNKLSGGEGSISKTVIGTLFISILSNGLNSLGIQDDFYFLIKGVIILLALTLEVTSGKMKLKYNKELNQKLLNV